MLNTQLQEIRIRRKQLEEDKTFVKEILGSGIKQAREVRKAMNMEL